MVGSLHERKSSGILLSKIDHSVHSTLGNNPIRNKSSWNISSTMPNAYDNLTVPGRGGGYESADSIGTADK